MIIDIGDIIYWEGVPHKVREIESKYYGEDGWKTFYFEDICGGASKIKTFHMEQDSHMYDEIMNNFYKIDNQIMPLAMARDIRIDEILND
jgi:hypothetical protein